MNWLNKLGNSFTKRHRIFERGNSGKYYSGSGHYWGRITPTGRVTNPGGYTRGYVSRSGRFHRT